MAKQLGLHKVQGKVGEYSYYESKNGGAVIRGINKGMSSRVKTAQEYANTRKNNSEFGMCGDFAGAIIKPISLRWRFILNSIATGMMVKEMKSLVALDSAGQWGKRVVKLANYGSLYEKFNSFSKNEIPSQISSALAAGVTYNSTTQKIILPSTGLEDSAFVEYMDSIGATSFGLQCFALLVTKPSFDGTTGTYTKAESKLVPINTFSSDTEDVDPGEEIYGANEVVLPESPVSTEAQFAGFLTIFLPQRKIGGSVNVLQQHCAAYLVPVTAAA